MAKQYSCEIVNAGIDWDGSGVVCLREVGGAFNDWYRANPEYKKEIMAIALMALNTKKKVSVGFQSDNPPKPMEEFTRFSFV